MVKQCSCGHIFFTLSAADTHWPDLHRLIEEVRAIEMGQLPLDITTLTPEQAQRRRVANVNDYPQICASFLYYRFKLFLNTIKKIPQLDYVEYWCRFEWQFRGSGHIHGILWLKNGPKIEDKNLESQRDREELVDFYMQLVYGSAPIAGHPRPAVNPCQVSYLPNVQRTDVFEQKSGPPEGKDNRTDLTELVNRCQHHTCTENYCLRRHRVMGRMKCRFGFPHEVKQHLEIAKNDKNQWVFLPLRQDCDRDLNKYCPIILSIW